MEISEVVSVTGGSTTFDLVAIAFAVATLALGLAFAAGGVSGLLRSRTRAARSLSAVSLVSGGLAIGALVVAVGTSSTAIVFGAVGVLGLGVFAGWTAVLVDCLTKEPTEGNDRIVWTMVIIFTGFVGAAIYLFARRPQRMLEYGR